MFDIKQYQNPRCFENGGGKKKNKNRHYLAFRSRAPVINKQQTAPLNYWLFLSPLGRDLDLISVENKTTAISTRAGTTFGTWKYNGSRIIVITRIIVIIISFSCNLMRFISTAKCDPKLGRPSFLPLRSDSIGKEVRSIF